MAGRYTGTTAVCADLVKMRGGTLSVLLLAAVAVVYAVQPTQLPATKSFVEDFEKIDSRLDTLTTRIGKLIEKIESRTNPARLKKAGSLKVRVQKLEGSGCGKNEFQCGGDNPQCIGNLFVCDGTKDCRNGADEAQCQLPISVGDVFEGHVLWDKCTKRQPEVISFEIKAIQTASFFTGFPKIKANVLIEASSASEGLQGSVALPTVGLYKFSQQKLVLQPPEADRLGLSCVFDGYNFDKCDGYIWREASVEKCAEIAFIKKQ